MDERFGAANSPTDQALVIALILVGLVVTLANPHPRIGDNTGGVLTSSRPTGRQILLNMMYDLDYQFITHGSLSA